MSAPERKRDHDEALLGHSMPAQWAFERLSVEGRGAPEALKDLGYLAGTLYPTLPYFAGSRLRLSSSWLTKYIAGPEKRSKKKTEPAALPP